ncbi:MAG: hypothetical protein HFI99_04325 [Lachnospiraceae bacterium]|jgi:hypothetical protein|nr:hypothetical protein [Lachnospiraceae bacterium]
MNKRIPFILIAILFIIALTVWTENNNTRTTKNGEYESIDNIRKNAKYPYEEESNYLYKEPYVWSDDEEEGNENDTEYEFIELKSGYENAE